MTFPDEEEEEEDQPIPVSSTNAKTATSVNKKQLIGKIFAAKPNASGGKGGSKGGKGNIKVERQVKTEIKQENTCSFRRRLKVRIKDIFYFTTTVKSRFY